MSYKRLMLPVMVLIVTLGVGVFLWNSGENMLPAENNTQSTGDMREPSAPAPAEPQGFDKTKHSIDEPASIWQIVNKNRSIGANYVPPDLVVPDVRLRLAASSEQMKFRKIAEQELINMFNAAGSDGVALVFGSGYRSYSLQKQFYDSYVARDGQAAADRYSARPGTSEHQTGLSFDVTSPSQTCHLKICFKDTPQGQWVKEHSHKYGFIIRYPEGKEAVTGYQYEPWHLRYVGKDLAAEVNKTNQTLEEFFGLN